MNAPAGQTLTSKSALGCRLNRHPPAILQQKFSTDLFLFARFPNLGQPRLRFLKHSIFQNVADKKLSCTIGMLASGKLALEVIAVSVKVVDGRLEYLRHTATKDENEIIALRETLRGYIDRHTDDESNDPFQERRKRSGRVQKD